MKNQLIKLVFVLFLIVTLLGCTEFTDRSQSAEVSTVDNLVQEYAQEWADHSKEGHFEAMKIAGESRSGVTPLSLEKRKKIAHENGITEEDAEHITNELAEFAERIGFTRDEVSSMFETPYFFVDAEGELVDTQQIKATLSYAMYTRNFYSPFDERARALYEEYAPYFAGEISDPHKAEKLYNEYEEKLETIKTELNEAKQNAEVEPGEWFLLTHEYPVSE